MNAAVAERLLHGRVILAGDAAHQLPPTGGFGVNTGIQGVHNLAWKLAMVRKGLAGRGLLETYDVERRAVGRYNADRSLENSRMVQQITAAAMSGGSSPKDAVAASKRYGNFLGMELGFAYESAAVVPDGTEPPEVEDEVIDYVPSGRPGHRAPHVWLERDGKRCLDARYVRARVRAADGRRADGHGSKGARRQGEVLRDRDRGAYDRSRRRLR